MTPFELRRLAATFDAGIAQRTPPPGSNSLVSDILGLAHVTGAPRPRLLRVVAEALDTNIAIERDATLASASARQSALILSLLPVGTVVAAQLFGVNTLRFLCGGPAGWLCLAIGVIATIAGWKWMEILRRRIVCPPVHCGLVGDLAAEVLSVSGLSAEANATLAHLANQWGTHSEWVVVGEIRSTARDSGVPVAGLLRAAAEECRRAARFTVRDSVERLPGRMLAPLGVCLFPAFITLTVIPAVAGMAQGFFRTSG